MTCDKEAESQRNILKSETVKKINPHLLSLLPIEEETPSRHISATSLLCSKRFDLLAKYIYAKHRELKIDNLYAKRLYCDHIKAFNEFREEDGSEKFGAEAFLSSFHNILDSIKHNGFCESETLIPIANENVIIDGAHRIAACLLYEKMPRGLFFNVAPQEFNYAFFKERGLAEKWCDAVALEYCRLEQSSYIVTVFPSAAGHHEAVKQIVNDSGEIFYEKLIHLNTSGSILLMRQIYKTEPWLGDWANQYQGAKNKALACFRRAGPMRMFVVKSNQDDMQTAKKKIRALFNIANDSVHINDTHAETIRIAQALLNENSIHFLNYAQPRYFKVFFDCLDAYQKWMADTGLNQEYFCVDGSSVMAMYGIREARDLDFLHFGYDDQIIKHPLIGSHNNEVHHHITTRDEIIFNPENHFYFNGIKFASLNIVKQMKKKRNEFKDKVDVNLINAFLRKAELIRWIQKIFNVR